MATFDQVVENHTRQTHASETYPCARTAWLVWACTNGTPQLSPSPFSLPLVGCKRTHCNCLLNSGQARTWNATFHPLFRPFSSFSRSRTLPVPWSYHSRLVRLDTGRFESVLDRFGEASGVEIYTDMFLVTCRTRWKLLWCDRKNAHWEKPV